MSAGLREWHLELRIPGGPSASLPVTSIYVMTHYWRLFSAAFLLAVLPAVSAAETTQERQTRVRELSSRDWVVTAHRVTGEIRVDGRLDDPDWRNATPIAEFFQRERNEGIPSTERTEVRVLFDQANLYIGFSCFDAISGNPPPAPCSATRARVRMTLSRSCSMPFTITARPSSWYRPAELGHIHGLLDAKPGRNLEILPYALAGTQKPRFASRNNRSELGLDAKWGITPGLTMDFTVNTDFAQEEVDSLQINFTRFSLVFPEKRQFFLEGQRQFQFGLGGENDLGRGRSVRCELPVPGRSGKLHTWRRLCAASRRHSAPDRGPFVASKRGESDSSIWSRALLLPHQGQRRPPVDPEVGGDGVCGV